MKPTRRWNRLCFTQFACLVCMLIVVEVTCADVLSPGSIIGGKSIGEWTSDWWNWAVREPTATNPVADPTGAFAQINQPGRPVFFLAGTFGGDASRSFDVPVGTHLLIPLVNVVAWSPESGSNETSLRELVNEEMDNVSELYFSLDGELLPNPFEYREQSPPFVLSIPPNSIFTECCGVAAGDREPAVSAGYWVMLEPLPRGQHLLEFGGQIGADGGSAIFSTSVTANLNVVQPRGRSFHVVSTVPEPEGAPLFVLVAIGLASYHRHYRRRALYS